MPTGRFSHTNPHDSFDNDKAYAKQKLINLSCCEDKEAEEKKRAEENSVSCAAPDEKNDGYGVRGKSAGD